MPTDSCTCAPYSEIRELFPEWATGADVQTSMQLGVGGVLPQNEEWKVCPDRGT